MSCCVVSPNSVSPAGCSASAAFRISVTLACATASPLTGATAAPSSSERATARYTSRSSPAGRSSAGSPASSLASCSCMPTSIFPVAGTITRPSNSISSESKLRCSAYSRLSAVTSTGRCSLYRSRYAVANVCGFECPTATNPLLASPARCASVNPTYAAIFASDAAFSGLYETCSRYFGSGCSAMNPAASSPHACACAGSYASVIHGSTGPAAMSGINLASSSGTRAAGTGTSCSGVGAGLHASESHTTESHVRRTIAPA